MVACSGFPDEARGTGGARPEKCHVGPRWRWRRHQEGPVARRRLVLAPSGRSAQPAPSQSHPHAAAQSPTLAQRPATQRHSLRKLSSTRKLAVNRPFYLLRHPSFFFFFLNNNYLIISCITIIIIIIIDINCYKLILLIVFGWIF